VGERRWGSGERGRIGRDCALRYHTSVAGATLVGRCGRQRAARAWCELRIAVRPLVCRLAHGAPIRHVACAYGKSRDRDTDDASDQHASTVQEREHELWNFPDSGRTAIAAIDAKLCQFRRSGILPVQLAIRLWYFQFRQRRRRRVPVAECERFCIG
jgi:hypothetical protein